MKTEKTVVVTLQISDIRAAILSHIRESAGVDDFDFSVTKLIVNGCELSAIIDIDELIAEVTLTGES